jgi:hypothetical protein
MGWWRRLLGTTRTDPSREPTQELTWKSRPGWLVDSLKVAVLSGPETLEVVGESAYQDELWTVIGGRRDGYVRYPIPAAVLVAETGNPYDPNAVSVWVRAAQVGYLRVGYISREQAAPLRHGLQALAAERGGPIALAGTVVGGHDFDHPAGMLGVFLDWDPADFAMASPLVHRPPSRLRTGLSEAMSTDAEDDSYDLGWLDQLPADPTRRIARLRALLADSIEPVSRHYQHELLVRELYRRRDRSEADMTAFDAAAEAHHHEMPKLKPALIAKFGGVPTIETYRFASIRRAKAADWAGAVDWCERGLAVYADQVIRADAVQDLQARAARCWKRLNPDHPVAATPRPMPRGNLASGATTPTGVGAAVAGNGAHASAVQAIETLTCQRCGNTFQRAVVRGRKPHLCPDCRDGGQAS